jgi:hypothetical protein
VLNQLLGHARHIRWFPREYVTVGPKKTDERAFLFVTQAASNQSCLGWSAFSQLDGLDADVAGVGFYPGLAGSLIGDLHLCVSKLLCSREDFCRRFWHA